MSPMKTEDQMERTEPAESRSEPTRAGISGVMTKSGPVTPSAAPREIVVYCEGFDAREQDYETWRKENRYRKGVR